MTKTQPMTKGGGADAPDKSDAPNTRPTIEPIEQQPLEGGAFVRLPDGSLKREEEA